MCDYIRAIPPGRCKSKRQATWWEKLKNKLFGNINGFDIEEETRCYRYEGHEEFGYEHKDMHGNKW